MSHDEALSRAFNRAVVEHFGPDGQADAGEVMIAGCTVVGSYIAGVRDPVARGVMLAQAQWMLGRMVAEVVMADATKRGTAVGPEFDKRRVAGAVPAPLDDDAPMTLDEAAEVLLRGAVTASTLRAAIGRAELTFERIGRSLMVTPAGVRDWRKRCRVLAEAPTSLKASASGAEHWYIRDGARHIATGCDKGNAQGAREALEKHIGRTLRPAARTGDPDHVLVSAVIDLYARDIAPSQARPHESAQRLARLEEFFGGMPVGEVTPSTCAAYVRWRTKEGERLPTDPPERDRAVKPQSTRRELADLQSAFTHAW